MTEKIALKEVLVVEGRYDAGTLASLVDALILTTNGFSIFTNEEQKALLQMLAKQRGVIILTDSDAAGFRIRHYVEKLVAGCKVTHVYIPAILGKESRKKEASKEGLLGVEGMSHDELRKALKNAGVQEGKKTSPKEQLCYHDLYELGISGKANSAEARRAFLHSVGLPQRLSKKALLSVLSSLYTKKELQVMLKPVLFWDFHGTLTLPDIVWFDVVKELAAKYAPEILLTDETLIEHLGGKCLPWFSLKDRDTRSVKGSVAWWGHCEKEFVQMFLKCGFSQEKSEFMAPRVREKVLSAQRYTLYEDAIPTLKALQERGYRHYLLSNNYPELEALANQLGLAPYLSGTVVSGEVGYAKPRKEIFNFARSLAKNPPACYLIGDSPIDDIEGAKMAGFGTVYVHPRPGQTAKADYCVQTLNELLEVFL